MPIMQGKIMGYDIDYYDKTLRLNSGTAEKIARIRWKFIEHLNPKIVLDYGCGAGWFRAWKPEGVICDSYDIAPVPQSGIQLRSYDVVCLWDVLEHVPDPMGLKPIYSLAEAVAISTPIIPQSEIWFSKHYKPGEHLYYFSRVSLTSMMAKMGFYLDREGTPECPPRRDVCSFLFRK